MKLRTYRDEYEIDDYYRDNHPTPDGPGLPAIGLPTFVTATWAVLAAGLSSLAAGLGGATGLSG